MKIFLWIKIQTVRKAIMRIGRRKEMRKLNPKVIFFTIMILLIIIPLIMRFFTGRYGRGIKLKLFTIGISQRIE